MPDPAASKVREFFLAGTLLRFQRGDIILQADEEPDGVYLIEKGFVKVYSILNSGENNQHVVYKAGELFPLLWAFERTQLHVFYEALDETEVRRVSKAEFRRFMANDPAVSAHLVERLAEVFWIYANRVENLGLARARDRVIYRLIFMMERFGKPNQLGEVIIDAPLTQQDIAESVKMIRETASREIEKLERSGILSYRNHRIVVLDPAKLRAELQN